MTWKLADAKNRLSELVTKVTTEGPQTIRRNRDTVVVIAESEYRALKGEELNFTEFLLSIPKIDDLSVRPRKSRMRNPNL